MPDPLLQATALFGMLVIACLFALEVRKWGELDAVIGRRQRMLRIWLMVLVEALFVMMFAGPYVTSRKDPIVALLYWTVCAVLGLAVVALTLVELRAVVRRFSRMIHDIRRDLAGDEEIEK